MYNDDPDNTSAYISAYKTDYTPDDCMAVNYFKGVGFSNTPELFIVTTDDNFNPDGHAYFIDFSQNKPLCIRMDIDALEEKYNRLSSNKKEFIYVRAEAFMCVIKNKLPWEYISIGFNAGLNEPRMCTMQSLGIILQTYTLAKSILDTTVIVVEPVQNLVKAVFYFKKACTQCTIALGLAYLFYRSTTKQRFFLHFCI